MKSSSVAINRSALLLVIFIIWPLLLQSNAEWYEQAKTLAEQRKYRDAIRIIDNSFDGLVLWQDKLRADYLLAVCYCRSESHDPAKGLRLLELLPRIYRNLGADAYSTIELARDACSDQRKEMVRAAVWIHAMDRGVRLVQGKGGLELMQLGSDHHTGFEISDDELEQRIFKATRSSDKSMTEKIESVAGTSYRVVSSPHFALCGVEGTEALRRRAHELERLLAAFCRQYRMNPPPTITTVYIVPSRKELPEFARRVHGIDLPEMYGYSFPYDSSIVIAFDGGLGTLGHELFHAVLLANFPEAPPWLNEGYAALYEEYSLLPETAGIRGTFRTAHWRIPHLKESRPGLRELIWMEWREMDDREAFNRNQSLAKMFAMYLQDERKTLEQVYHAFRSADFKNQKGDLRKQYETTLLRALKSNSMEGVQQDFDEWLSSRLPQ